MICADGDYTLWLVIDTNILIEDLEHLKEFHREVTLGGQGGPFKDIHFEIRYYIPKKVYSELCAHKDRGALRACCLLLSTALLQC